MGTPRRSRCCRVGRWTPPKTICWRARVRGGRVLQRGIFSIRAVSRAVVRRLVCQSLTRCPFCAPAGCWVRSEATSVINDQAGPRAPQKGIP